MNDLSLHLQDLRKNYRNIFLKISRDVNQFVYISKPEDVSGEIFDYYAENSSGRIWQLEVLKNLDELLHKDLDNGFAEIKNYYNEASCVGCGVCCKLACSEFSPEELQDKAADGDVFAKQFLGTFVPYETKQEVLEIFPEYLKLLDDNDEVDYYFYHCPKVTSDNRCPDYENRPQICRDFPDNPLAFLPLSCGYMDWKLKSEHISLKLNAESEIIAFYINKIKGLYNE